jgi:hypothetical protein
MTTKSMRDAYLDFIKRCLSGIFNEDPAYVVNRETQIYELQYRADRRARGGDIPSTAMTMIGMQRLDQLQWCVETILADDVPGDLLEAGVWRGGASMFMKAVLSAYEDSQRCVWLADSFRGLPEVDLEKYPLDVEWQKAAGKIAVSSQVVRQNFRRYGLLDERIRFLEGWFCDTLPSAPVEKIAVLRMDGDLYASTMDILDALYPRVSVGGFVIVDDYEWKSCRTAVHDYRERHGITERIHGGGAGAYWRVGERDDT